MSESTATDATDAGGRTLAARVAQLEVAVSLLNDGMQALCAGIQSATATIQAAIEEKARSQRVVITSDADKDSLRGLASELDPELLADLLDVLQERAAELQDGVAASDSE